MQNSNNTASSLNSAAVKDMYEQNPIAKKVIDYVTLHARGLHAIKARETARTLNLNEKKVVKVVKDLAVKANAGVFFTGRADAGTRIELIYPVDALEHAAHEGQAFHAEAPIRRAPEKRWANVKKAKAKRARPNPTPAAPVLSVSKEQTDVRRANQFHIMIVRPGYVVKIPAGLSEVEKERVKMFVSRIN